VPVLFGGGAAFSPSDIVGLQLWLLADDIAGNDGDAVASWVSKEGNAYDFAQATADKKPLLKKAANGINSKNTVLFDGSNDLLVYPSANISNASQGTVFAVIRFTAAIPNAAHDLLTSRDEAGTTNFLLLRAYLTNAIPNMHIYQRNNDTLDQIKGSTNFVAATPYLLAWISSGVAYTMRVGGSNETIVVSGGSNNGDWYGDTAGRDNFVVGASKSTTEANFLKGDVAEIIMYDTGLSAGNIALIEESLADKYGIALPP